MRDMRGEVGKETTKKEIDLDVFYDVTHVSIYPKNGTEKVF